MPQPSRIDVSMTPVEFKTYLSLLTRALEVSPPSEDDEALESLLEKAIQITKRLDLAASIKG